MKEPGSTKNLWYQLQALSANMSHFRCMERSHRAFAVQIIVRMMIWIVPTEFRHQELEKWLKSRHRGSVLAKPSVLTLQHAVGFRVCRSSHQRFLIELINKAGNLRWENARTVNNVMLFGNICQMRLPLSIQAVTVTCVLQWLLQSSYGLPILWLLLVVYLDYQYAADPPQ